MSQTLSTTIKGISLDERLLIAALDNLPTQAFSKSDFADALTDLGFGHASDSDLVRRVMQFLKRQGLIDFNDVRGNWALTTLGQMRLPHKTLPLLPAASQRTRPILQTNRMDQWVECFRLIAGTLACIALITALIGLNASFAWELGSLGAKRHSSRSCSLWASWRWI